MGGRRVKVERPRARSVDGHELSLPSWQAWSARDPLDERAFEQMVLGVSTRRYARSLEALPNEFEVHGVGKSAGERTLRSGDPASALGTDAARFKRACAGRLDDRWAALRRACGAGGGRHREQCQPAQRQHQCFCALCSRPRLLPFLFTAASSSFSNPIFRSGGDCCHFNFNSYSGIAIFSRSCKPSAW